MYKELDNVLRICFLINFNLVLSVCFTLNVLNVFEGNTLNLLRKQTSHKHPTTVYYLDELWEVVRVPLPDAHGEAVDVLVQLVQQTDALDDHVVDAVHVELDPGPRVVVPQAELGLDGVVNAREPTHQGVEVGADA